MRVGINVLAQSPRAFSGSLSQFLQMGKILPRMDPETRYSLLAGGADVDWYRERTAVDSVVNAGLSDRGTLPRIASEYAGLPLACLRAGVDVLFHGTSGTAPFVLPPRTKLVLGIWAGQAPSSVKLSPARRLYRQLLVRPALARADALILNSEYTRDLLFERHRIDAPATIVHHGVDSTLFHPGVDRDAGRTALTPLIGEAPYVLFVGQVYPYKLLHVLAEGFAKAVAKHKLPHRLVVMGSFAKVHNADGDAYRERIVDIVERHGLTDRVRFAAGLPVETLRRLYACADLYVQPSAAETFGRTVIEAMACGAPVVAARAAATPEVLGDAGLYYEPEDGDACAERIAAVLADPALAADLRARGFERVKRYTVENEMRAMASVFRQAAGLPPL